jgi:hypothetical protein
MAAPPDNDTITIEPSLMFILKVKDTVRFTRTRCHFVECPHLRGACHNLLALYASQ